MELKRQKPNITCRAVTPHNRTRMELKLYLNEHLTPGFETPNRTRMELKPFCGCIIPRRFHAPNRTRMELKQRWVLCIYPRIKPPNRTRMELKPSSGGDVKILIAHLIAPEWN